VGRRRAVAPEGRRSRPGRTRPSILAVLLMVGMNACEAEPSAWPGVDVPPPSALGGPLVPPQGTLLGAWVKPESGWLEPEMKDSLRSFESAIGRRLDIVHHYIPAGSALGWQPAWHISRGQIPMISWGGLNSTEVLEGTHDRYIASFARSVDALGQPVFLRYGAEMDGEGNRAWVVSPSAYVSAWRYIHQRFEGVPAVWVWAPVASAFTRKVAPLYYPGDRYVDWIAADGYNWNGCRGDAWEGFSQIFRDFYTWGSAQGKPLMVAETGTVEDPADSLRKAQWFAGAATSIKRSMPYLKAFVYFHSDRDCPWWIHSSTASLEGFRQLALDPHFTPGG
jgi:Glycosyl hydrolase family 26